MTEQLPGRIQPDDDPPGESWHAARDRLDAAEAAERALARGTDRPQGNQFDSLIPKRER